MPARQALWALPCRPLLPGQWRTGNHPAADLQATLSGGRPRRVLDRLALHPAPLALGQAAPDAEPLVVFEGVLQAFGPDLAAAADLLGLPGGAALLREEGFRICLRAECAILPTLLRSVFHADFEPATGRQRHDHVGHSAPPTPSISRALSPGARELHG